MKEAFIDHNFSPESLGLIAQANAIIEEYRANGLVLTVRQIYYQFVARDWIENHPKKYKKMVNLMTNARLAGYVDWRAIEDRTRVLKSNSHWVDEENMMDSAAKWFEIDKWDNQPARLEVWIEKDALSGVIAPVCKRLDVPFFACKGYTSISAMYRGAKRLAMYSDSGQRIQILHLGDHDPSGIDMTRDIEDRISLMAERLVKINRLALNFDQIDLYQPPPNFVKLKDSRAGDYTRQYGLDSWELDALDPNIMASIIEEAVLEHRDENIWNDDIVEETRMAKNLAKVRDNWDEVSGLLKLP